MPGRAVGAVELREQQDHRAEYARGADGDGARMPAGSLDDGPDDRGPSSTPTLNPIDTTPSATPASSGFLTVWAAIVHRTHGKPASTKP